MEQKKSKNVVLGILVAVVAVVAIVLVIIALSVAKKKSIVNKIANTVERDALLNEYIQSGAVYLEGEIDIGLVSLDGYVCFDDGCIDIILPAVSDTIYKYRLYDKNGFSGAELARLLKSADVSKTGDNEYEVFVGETRINAVADDEIVTKMSFVRGNDEIRIEFEEPGDDFLASTIYRNGKKVISRQSYTDRTETGTVYIGSFEPQYSFRILSEDESQMFAGTTFDITDSDAEDIVMELMRIVGKKIFF